MRDINLKAMEHFEAVARLGSVTKAGVELNVSASAVSQQIRHLEAQFGVRLFRREKRKLILTLEGDRLFQTTTQAFSAIRNAHGAIARQRNVRNLIVRVSPSFGVRWLGPRINGFLTDNPEWNIRIDATPDFSSFETEAVDFDLRYGLGGWAGLTENCIMHDLVLPLCSPEYLAELALISSDPVEQLQNARLVDSVKTIFRWDLWLASNAIEIQNLQYPIRFDRSSMALELAKQGGGLVLDSVTLCMSEILSGHLVPFSVNFEVIDFPAYWFVCPPKHYNRRIVQRFSQWLSKECEAHETLARQTLSDKGCRFKTESGAGLVQKTPWEL